MNADSLCTALASLSVANEPLVFNVTDVFAEDNTDSGSYLIKLFGRTADDRTVTVNVTDYTPHFYVQLGEHLYHVFDNWAKKSLGGLKKCNPLRRKTFWGFTNDEERPFVQLVFRSLRCMRNASATLLKGVSIPGVTVGKETVRTYESNIEPFLRFLHRSDISPCAWVRVEGGYQVSPFPSNTNVNVTVQWTGVHPHAQAPGLAPLRVASFDIECMSYDGEFPVAVRDVRMLAQQVVDHIGSDLENVPARLVNYVVSRFEAGQTIAKGLTREEAVAALRAPTCALVRMRNDIAAVAMTDDIDALARKLKLVLPPLEGDPIIQIGTTVHKYGQRDVYKRHIFVLGTCSPIPNVVVHEFESEAEMLREWSRFIVALDPDVMLGYNIFGFDMTYMYDRAVELGCEREVSKLGRVRGRVCPFVTKMLSSSALGDNLLKYWDIEGRVVIDLMKLVQRDHRLDSYKLDNVAQHFLGDRKDDVSPHEIFKLHLGDADDRARIARYCVQDCELLNRLCVKLEVIANNAGMANVCCVPLSWIFMRGQGVKIFSLVARQCKEDGYLVPVVKAAGAFGVPNPDDGYEGAIVLDPVPGMYMDTAIAVFDYASLYPSSMISENISHDTIVLDDKYRDLPGVEYVDITYEETGGPKVCRFAQNRKGVLPRILEHLLTQRKRTRRRVAMQAFDIEGGRELLGFEEAGDDASVLRVRLEDGGVEEVPRTSVLGSRPAFDEFERAVLDGLQLAYKVTANSLYGQVGARTSPLYLKDLAASTTATGRAMILKAKDFIEREAGGRVIYGDTDSVFVAVDGAGDAEGLVARAMEFGSETAARFRPLLKRPHELEFEKVFYPFIILSKKRYVGNVYEDSPDRFKQKSMGIVLKRRDNAHIVKTVYGGCIDILMNERNLSHAVTFLQDNLTRLTAGDFPLEELVITKSLRASYKDPERIAHKVLAERIGERDPGNKPQVNDRIPFVYIQSDDKKALQGDRIETPTYVTQAGLQPDYKFYITNQLMKPLQQLFGLVVERLPGYSHAPDYWGVVRAKLEADGLAGDKLADKVATLRENEVERLLFEPVLIGLGDKPRRRRAVLPAPAAPAPARKPRARKAAAAKPDDAQ